MNLELICMYTKTHAHALQIEQVYVLGNLEVNMSTLKGENAYFLEVL